MASRPRRRRSSASRSTGSMWPRPRRSPGSPRRPRATTRSSIPRPPATAVPTCCGACASSATSTPPPRRPPTRSRCRRARTRRSSTSRRRTSRRWRAWSSASGTAGHVELPAHGEPDYDDLVDEYSGIGNLSPAVVMSVAEKSARAYVKSLGTVQIDWDGLSWAHRQQRNETPGPPPKDASQVLSRGDVVYVVADAAGHAQLAQIPEAQSALVALDPNDGSIGALVGGFDYFTNKYNRVTQ